jgi:hypothetical protein
LLYDIGQAHRLGGDCAQALRYYADYLRREPDGPNRAGVEAKIAAMEACVHARDHLPARAGEIEPRPVEPPAPPPAPAPTTKPATKPTPPLARVVEPAPAVAPEAALATSPPRRSIRHPRLITGLALTAGGLALVAGAIYCSVQAADSSQKVTHFFDGGGRWSSSLQAIENSGRDATTASAALYSVGGALGVTGVALSLVYWSKER